MVTNKIPMDVTSASVKIRNQLIVREDLHAECIVDTVFRKGQMGAIFVNVKT
jgi:hypothetical protein